VAFFLIGEEDAVDKGVSALGAFDGVGEGFLAAAVDAVGEDHEGFAALLFFHEFIGGEVDGVVEKGAATVAVSVRAVAVFAAAAIAPRGSASGTGLGELWGAELIDGGKEFLAGGGEVLEKSDFEIEMDEESFIFVFAQHVIEEGAAGGAFLIEDSALAEAGVHEEAKG
jgi:hypothetical protein